MLSVLPFSFGVNAMAVPLINTCTSEVETEAYFPRSISVVVVPGLARIYQSPAYVGKPVLTL